MTGILRTVLNTTCLSNDTGKKNMSSISNILPFFKEFFRNPSKIAAISPSSKSLARLMTRSICPQTGPILELGPGTGVFTNELINRGVLEKNLVLIELSVDFAQLLENKFPKAQVLRLDATQLKKQSSLPQVSTVICGLGFLNMAPEVIKMILEGAFSHLKNNGDFFFFTYGSSCSIPQKIIDSLKLQVTYIGKTYRNLPPARVYKITRQRSI